MHDKHCQEDHHMPSCCWLDIIIAMMMLCLFQLRGTQTGFDRGYMLQGAQNACPILSNAVLGSRNGLIYFTLIAMGKMAWVCKHFSLRMVFRKELSLQMEVPLYMSYMMFLKQAQQKEKIGIDYQ